MYLTRAIALLTKSISYNQSQNLNIMTMIDIKDLAINYITNEVGEKTAVILPIEQFESLLEDLEDLAVVAERKNEPTTICDPLFEKARNAMHCQSPLRRRSGHSPCDEAVEQHRIKGESIAVSVNGKVKIVTPEDIIPLSRNSR
ncbi:MAG: hypothetical protein AAF383_14075 [Cyanobacteria bacterium P01_A01_bin.83]